MANNRPRRFHRILKFILPVLLGVCLLGAAVSALSNLGLPAASAGIDRLGELDKIRLEETFHLKDMLGEQVWPGWGELETPVILWNRAYSFLVGHPDPPAGWEAVPGDRFAGEIYYRKVSDGPQNFAVQVGDRQAASMATKSETDAFLISMFREMLPPGLEQIFPYRALILASEVQIAAVLHESFHVYQAQSAPERLEKAEQAHRLGDAYWAADEAMHADWEAEIDNLVEALNAGSQEEAARLARQFLEQRDRRRSEHELEPDLVDYERQLEWEEGLAKYVEIESLRQAFETAGYQPLAGLEQDPDFKGYRAYQRRWSQEIAQMKRQASRTGETRFYLTGMAQAFLLDRLSPGWKAAAFNPDIYLEALLGAATGARPAP